MCIVFKTTKTQGILSNNLVDDRIITWLNAFLIDRKAQGVSKGTVHFYEVKFKAFTRFCKLQENTNVLHITSNEIREYLLWLEAAGHNPGGCHAHYRAIRSFLYWYEDEVEPKDWNNPIKKVKAPLKPDQPLEPVSIENINKLINTCSDDSYTDYRDKAIFLSLLDTGARASEFLDVNIEDINQVMGDILIRDGKGRKPRTVFIGKQTRKSMRKYLTERNDNSPALWVSDPSHGSDRLSYWGLRSMIVRRSKSANIQAPTLHDFRRAFAIAMLREGVDIYTLAKLMGHSTIDVLKYYLKQTTADMAIAHRRHGPVDNLGF